MHLDSPTVRVSPYPKKSLQSKPKRQRQGEERKLRQTVFVQGYTSDW